MGYGDGHTDDHDDPDRPKGTHLLLRLLKWKLTIATSVTSVVGSNLEECCAEVGRFWVRPPPAPTPAQPLFPPFCTTTVLPHHTGRENYNLLKKP